jgi:tetratricopeptide (TPR) repeat protein
VLQVAPNDANTNFLAGMADAGLNDLKSATKHYEKALRADAKLIPAQQELAITYAKLGQRDKAEAALAKLKTMDAACAATCKDAEDIKNAISAVEAAIGQPAHAMLATDPPFLFASAKGGDTAYLQAVALINEHRYQEAIDALQRARTTFGAHPDVLTYLGFANRKLGRYDLAENYYHQALAAAPNHKGATEYYGELLVERGDLARAKVMLAKLDTICTFGCAEAEELRRWVEAKGPPAP